MESTRGVNSTDSLPFDEESTPEFLHCTVRLARAALHCAGLKCTNQKRTFGHRPNIGVDWLKCASSFPFDVGQRRSPLSHNATGRGSKERWRREEQLIWILREERSQRCSKLSSGKETHGESFTVRFPRSDVASGSPSRVMTSGILADKLAQRPVLTAS